MPIYTSWDLRGEKSATTMVHVELLLIILNNGLRIKFCGCNQLFLSKEALCSTNTEVHFSFEIQVCGLVEKCLGILVFALFYTRAFPHCSLEGNSSSSPQYTKYKSSIDKRYHNCQLA